MQGKLSTFWNSSTIHWRYRFQPFNLSLRIMMFQFIQFLLLIRIVTHLLLNHVIVFRKNLICIILYGFFKVFLRVVCTGHEWKTTSNLHLINSIIILKSNMTFDYYQLYQLFLTSYMFDWLMCISIIIPTMHIIYMLDLLCLFSNFWSYPWCQ
jgi:hypothetical protein